MINELSFTDITTDNITSIAPAGITLHVLRLDRMHPVISGNKWFKLKYYLDEARENACTNIVTFGGAWSNHIVATAAVCVQEGFKSTGIIRGERPAVLSPTLMKAQEYGMEFHFITRGEYSEKHLPAFASAPGYFVIPEGGAGPLGIRGAATLLDHTNERYTHYCCAVGTGTMLAGIASRLQKGQTLVGFNVLRNEGTDIAATWNGRFSNHVQLVNDYHFGGYARKQPPLIDFMNTFFQATGIPSDFVYTGKLFYGVNDLLIKGFFPINSRILLIHSGGLQGNSSLPGGTLLY